MGRAADSLQFSSENFTEQPSISSENQGDTRENFGGHGKGLTEVICKPLIFLVGHR